MTLLKDNMQAAGVDTAKARLAALAVTALQGCKGSIPAAVEALFRKLGNEPWVLKEALLKPFLEERLSDMRGPLASRVPADLPPSVVRRQSDPERKRAVAQVVQRAVDAIRFKHLTSDGRDWAEVGAHELYGMDRDGALARVIKDRLGVLSNEQKFKPLGELMTPMVFNEVRASLGN